MKESSSWWQDSDVGELFSAWLKRYWPQGSDGRKSSQDEKLLHVLSWKPMAQFFKYFGMLFGCFYYYYKCSLTLSNAIRCEM